MPAMPAMTPIAPITRAMVARLLASSTSSWTAAMVMPLAASSPRVGREGRLGLRSAVLFLGGSGELQHRCGVLGFLAARGRLVDPGDLFAARVGLDGLEHELVGVVGERAGGDGEVLVLAGLDRATGPGDLGDGLGDLAALGLDGFVEGLLAWSWRSSPRGA